MKKSSILYLCTITLKPNQVDFQINLQYTEPLKRLRVLDIPARDRYLCHKYLPRRIAGHTICATNIFLVELLVTLFVAQIFVQNLPIFCPVQLLTTQFVLQISIKYLQIHDQLKLNIRAAEMGQQMQLWWNVGGSNSL